MFVQRIIEFETEIKNIATNPLDKCSNDSYSDSESDFMIQCFCEKLKELFNSSRCDILNPMITNKVLSVIFDPMNIQKYRSCLQYEIIKRYSPMCIDLLDNQIFEFYNKSIKNRSSKIKSLIVVNKYVNKLIEKKFIDIHLCHQDKNVIKMMIDQIMEEGSDQTNKIITVSGLELTEYSSKDSSKDINESDTLYDIDKLLHCAKTKTHIINFYHDVHLNQYVFPAALFQLPYYSSVSVSTNLRDNLSASFGGIGVFIAFHISDHDQKIDDNTMNRVMMLLKKYLDPSHLDSQPVIKDVILMINALKLSLRAMVQNLNDNGIEEIRSQQKIFFESYALAHKHNTRKYNINDSVQNKIILKGEFWVNLVTCLDEFHETYGFFEMKTS